MTAVQDAPPRLAEQGHGSRLLAHPSGSDWTEHLRHWRALPSARNLIGEVERAGLRGRGGAGFPTGTKLATVTRAARHRPAIVVGNGVESEPLSFKDQVLLEQAPHLVIDGMVAAAQAVGADAGVLCVKERSSAFATVRQALAVRRSHDPVSVELASPPPRYLAGQESALVNWLTSGRLLPTLTPPRPAERGVDRRPTLIDNVETLANIGLIARFGGAWWRQIGAPEEPGSTLLTVTGAVEHPGVQEVATGTLLASVLSHAGAGPAAGLLLGGYFGTWIRPDQVDGLTWDRVSLAQVGAAPGCGAIAVLPDTCCPLVEVARVLRWLAGQSAGQCGPCVNGLPAISNSWQEVAQSDPEGRHHQLIQRWSAQIKGRGGCQLPDGAIAFASSALRAFKAHIHQHRTHGSCAGAQHPRVLPTPPTAAGEPVRLSGRSRRAL